MKDKGSKLLLLFVFVLIAAVGFSVYWLFLKPDEKAPEVVNGGGVGIVDDSKDTENTDTTPGTDTETEKTPVTETPVTEPDPTTTDFTTFLSTQQTVGDSKNKAQYTLKSITDTKKDGFHRFDFAIQSKTSETMEAPYVVVKYNSTLGAIRVDLNYVTKDESGIGYQKSRSINEQGVTKLYHNISSDPNEELYDIGVSKTTVFKLTSVEGAENTWTVTVDVKYPGASTSSDSFGVETFSKDLTALDGGLSVDSAKVISYSFSTEGNVFSLVFNVSGSTNRPVPSATAKYLDNGDLELTFTDIVSDGVYKALDGKKIGGYTFDTTRTGTKSVYLIKGPTKEFRLIGSKSPNQVVLDIKM